MADGSEENRKIKGYPEKGNDSWMPKLKVFERNFYSIEI